MKVASNNHKIQVRETTLWPYLCQCMSVEVADHPKQFFGDIVRGCGERGGGGGSTGRGGGGGGGGGDVVPGGAEREVQ